VSEQNKQVVRRVLDELFDKGDLDATDELIHPDFVNHEAPPDNPQGPEGLKETITWLRGLWGPMRAEIEDEISEGDKVVARVTMHGDHVGEFLGKPAARDS
jgi:ketosteroid isomerase-like protein